jgi:hypothetical protein
MDAKTTTSNSPEKKARHRSPNYPAVGLRNAVERIRSLYQKNGKAGAPAKLAAVHIGFASAHGEAMSVVAALKKFGLVESTKGRVAPTQRAIEIINLPETDSRREQALKDAALSPAIYRELIEQHRETGFPADDVLQSELVTYKDFNPRAVAGFVKDFKDTLDFAGLSDLAELESEIEQRVEEPSEMPQPLIEPPKIIPPLPQSAGQKKTSINSWTLSREVSAQLRIDGEVSKEDLDLLRDYVEITIKALSRKEGKPE